MPIETGVQNLEQPRLEQPDQRDRIAGSSSDSWHPTTEVEPAIELTEPNSLITASNSKSLQKPGALSAEPGRAAEDTGVDLWPQVGSRDQVVEVHAGSADLQDQSAETAPKTDDGMWDHLPSAIQEHTSTGTETGHQPKLDIDVATGQVAHVESLSPELTQESALETGPFGHHSFETPPSDRFEQQIEPAGSIFQHAPFDQTGQLASMFDGSAERVQLGPLVPDAQLADTLGALEGRVDAPTAGSTHRVAGPETGQGAETAETTELGAFDSVSSDRTTSVTTIADLERESAMEEEGGDDAEELDLAIASDLRLPSPVNGRRQLS